MGPAPEASVPFLKPIGMACVRLAAHALTFVAVLVLLEPQGVAPSAWWGVATLGALFLVLAPGHPAYSRSARWWLGAAVVLAWLSAGFAGADFALRTLGNSVKARASLPPLLGGLELHWLLCPGLFSVAVGALAGAALERRRDTDDLRTPGRT